MPIKSPRFIFQDMKKCFFLPVHAVLNLMETFFVNAKGQNQCFTFELLKIRTSMEKKFIADDDEIINRLTWDLLSE